MATAPNVATAALDRCLDPRDAGSTIAAMAKFAAFNYLRDPEGRGNNAQHEHADTAEDAGHQRRDQEGDELVRNDIGVLYAGLPWAVQT